MVGRLRLVSCDDTSAQPVFALRYELPLTVPDRSRCLQADRQSPSPHRLRKHAKSQGPLLRRHFPASTLAATRSLPQMARGSASAKDYLVVITRRINGGLNGLASRREWLAKLKRVIK